MQCHTDEVAARLKVGEEVAVQLIVNRNSQICHFLREPEPMDLMRWITSIVAGQYRKKSYEVQ